LWSKRLDIALCTSTDDASMHKLYDSES
jgi:hypothetical protein